MRCIKCANDSPLGSQFCQQCGLSFVETERAAGRSERSPVAALLLSMFLPAVGQLYNGELKKAIAIWIGYAVGLLLSAVAIGPLILLGVWVWSMVDAYKTASSSGKR